MSDLEFRWKKPNSNQWHDWTWFFPTMGIKKTWLDYLIEEIPFTSVRTWNAEDSMEWRTKE